MSRCTIIQYNCGNANQGACRPFFDNVTPADHQVLAVQELVYNKYTKLIYCLRGFTFIYNALPTTKVCFIISWDINAMHWKRKQYGPFWPKVKTAIKEAKGEIILLGDFNAHHPIWGKKHIASKEQAEYLLAKTNAK